MKFVHVLFLHLLCKVIDTTIKNEKNITMTNILDGLIDKTMSKYESEKKMIEYHNNCEITFIKFDSTSKNILLEVVSILKQMIICNNKKNNNDLPFDLYVSNCIDKNNASFLFENFYELSENSKSNQNYSLQLDDQKTIFIKNFVSLKDNDIEKLMELNEGITLIENCLMTKADFLITNKRIKRFLELNENTQESFVIFVYKNHENNKESEMSTTAIRDFLKICLTNINFDIIEIEKYQPIKKVKKYFRLKNPDSVFAYKLIHANNFKNINLILPEVEIKTIFYTLKIENYWDEKQDDLVKIDKILNKKIINSLKLSIINLNKTHNYYIINYNDTILSKNGREEISKIRIFNDLNKDLCDIDFIEEILNERMIEFFGIGGFFNHINNIDSKKKAIKFINNIQESLL